MTNEEFQKLVLQELSSIKEDITGIKVEVSTIKEDVSNIKGQLNENTGFIKALIHRTDELDAKFDGLLNTTANKDALARVEKSVDDIRKLRKAE